MSAFEPNMADQQAPTKPVPTTGMPPRTRMHSWSRLRRSPEEKARMRNSSFHMGDFEDTEQQVEAEAQICFSKDGDWFQGNINPPYHCVIQLQGRRYHASNRRRNSSVPTSPSSGPGGLVFASSSSADFNPVSDSASDASMQSLASFASISTSRSRKTSDCSSESCSIDSEAVQEVLNKLAIEEGAEDDDEGVSVSEPDLYRVTVSDLETGLSYKLDTVAVERSKTACAIISDQLNFRSNHVYIGCSANQALLSQFGPSFVDRDLVLFNGQSIFKYSDKIYRPVHATETMAKPETSDKFWQS